MSGTIRLRARGPQGTATISIDSNATYGHLKREISEKTGVADFDIKYGFPPQPLNTESISAETKLSDLPVKLNGEQLIVSPLNVQSKLSEPLAGSTRAPETVKALPPRELISPPQHKAGDFPDKPLSLARKPKGDVESDPPEVPVSQLEGVMILRVMPDDNSCMFRALSSAVLPGIDTMNELRSIVAEKIQHEKDFFTKDMLEKEPDDYCRWIQREDAWGGGIELSILSQHFGIEICSINVQDCRVDRFNEGQATRCILVYSGIHYDVCAVAPFSGAEPEFDRKVFDVLQMDGEEIDGGALQAAVELCKILQSRHYYTDTQGFSLKCNQCGQKGNGEKWALQHAESTGHGDFGEND
ncbi:OTU-like cysteine protease [Pseudocercospora fijiensis CIRAD86]|uniref:Ubiquitin thioesterase OTU n=1 Tax=Pseudocercospora fijiensis (strain CIRAD86) TaxID=383855 RepID=M2ZGA5_PSEFD|nr:OTU-like cysteine protease [Pseudocercospora fijiensis CIRAD86]EME78169.1 OTU-like cysteine protease [Pseudocercospora fijiensis CIRAD86]